MASILSQPQYVNKFEGCLFRPAVVAIMTIHIKPLHEILGEQIITDFPCLPNGFICNNQSSTPDYPVCINGICMEVKSGHGVNVFSYKQVVWLDF